MAACHFGVRVWRLQGSFQDDSLEREEQDGRAVGNDEPRSGEGGRGSVGVKLFLENKIQITFSFPLF